ncbi:MAG TPA: 4-hydroxy-tetrahydrodipicolinate synthase [Spirochaetota bacterium]|nr:4-hydroxy-tetrahydrodipicolinate synthase [Spirochaetota bacterium]HOS38499.1 4-hydroxy-tetrahydrodipicolinate synthase [Spirochaetota bacterium]HPI23992.1 4-hydroxy-tetrahydrodipicolinate synthase [Spirochaetota bacterium]HPU89847.1 4-hydroxy-tetrahydrodipicolinate synthase [Spirochaetota bacterium]
MFEGLHTALVTPFKDGGIDYDALERIVELQIAGGVDGILPMGTTGESPTVSYEEHKEFIRRVVKLARGRVKVIAGTGSNATDEAICLSKAAADDGVDGIMLVNPYYNKPPQRGMVAHFAAIAQAVPLPVIIYNIPGRTGINFLPESLTELADRCANVVAVKEATGDIAQMMRTIELLGDRITLLSGDDNLLLPVLSIGGRGVISVLSNAFPAEVKRVIVDYEAGRIDEARANFYRLLPLCRAMFLETNPIPVKAAMELLGHCSSDVRLPLMPLSEENRRALKRAIDDFGASR